MISYNSLNFIKDGKPWFPIMGEYPYSRTDCNYWSDGMAKMKALGLDVVSTYVFWIHHEEIKGHFNFRGNNNLRKFVRNIKDAGMMMCLRIGPWIHAEARNGGFPDWMEKQSYKPRTNDKGYLQDVETFFTELYKQCEGYLYKNGGPIFAIQVENEYSQWGVQGNGIGDEHINELIKMLKRIGFDVPVYMATGWGQAAVGAAIPVWGGYCEAPWEYSNKELPPVDSYIISSNPNDENIGSDTGKKAMSADITKCNYPYATVELGAGVQVTKIRRPIVAGEDTGAIVLCKLAGGMSALGYYIFHGGIHPVGALTSTQEYRDADNLRAGFCCDLPERDYDFQAAIGQFGRMHAGAFELKLWNYFIKDFGGEICQMPLYLPVNKTDPCDLKNLRYSIRRNGKSGYIFFNNYVRRYDMPQHTLNDFVFNADDELIKLHNFTLKNKQYCAFPFNLKLGGGLLKVATATPFCTLNNNDFVFWSEDGNADYIISEPIKGNIITLNKESAKKCFKFEFDGMQRLFMADGELFESELRLEYCYTNEPIIKVYPAPQNTPKDFKRMIDDGIFAVYKYAEKNTLKNLEKNTDLKASVLFKKLSENNQYTDYQIEINYNGEKSDNVFINIEYGGDSIDIIIDGEKVTDSFYTGKGYEFGLKNYNFPKNITARVHSMLKNDFVFTEIQPRFNGERAAYIDKISIETQFRILLIK